MQNNFLGGFVCERRKCGYKEGKLVLPLAVRVHHAVCDGYHVAMFLQDLQRRMDTF